MPQPRAVAGQSTSLASFAAALGLAGALALAPAGALSQGAKTSAVTDADISQLKPGQFIWAPNLAPAGPMLMVVNLKAQQAYVYRNGVRIGASTISSGKEGKATPTGVFTILQKKTKHNSNLYNNASMPYMQRLTWDGIALHAGNLPGYPASHGCVRLPHAFAVKLFGATSLGMTVVITDEGSTPRRLDSGDLLVPVSAKGAAPSGLNAKDRLGPQEPYRWTPDIAPSGPVTLVLGIQEQRLVVMRNGKIIGRSRVRIPQGQFSGTKALAFTGFNAGGRSQWVYVDVPGEKRAGETFDITKLQGIEAPPAYIDKVRTVLKPGATLIVTDSGILSGGAGKPMTVIDG